MATTSTKFPVTELDFLQIKKGLKDYLKGQDRFADYDFEGSNLSVLLDVLSYNTFQNNFYTNMAISEMFLDSAQLKDSIVSHAKELNYLPRSMVSARAIVDVSLNVNDTPPFITIPEKTKFTAKCNNTTYTFYNERSATIFRNNDLYVFPSLDIYEGTYITEQYVITQSPSQRILISNPNIDLNSIRVKVKEGDDENEFVYAADLYGLTSTSKIFFVQPYVGDRYEIFFGRDIFGIQPKTSSIIEIEYRATAGPAANGVINFSLPNPIAGYPAGVALRAPSRGGADREDLKSIKYFAPKTIQVQERAITAQDFSILLRRRFPEIKAISVYGGENASPPQYGRVVVAVDLGLTTGISADTRERYRTYLKDRCSLSIEPVITNAQYMYYDIETAVVYNTKTTDKSSGDILQLVNDTILNFSSTNLQDFKKNFRLTKLTGAINSADENILSNRTYVRAIIDISPNPNSGENFTLDFANKLLAHPPRSNPRLKEGGEGIPVGVISSPFIFQNFVAFIRDNGRGVLQIVTRDQNNVDILLRDVGTVNYETGVVNIRNLRVVDYDGPAIKIFATPVSKDIIAPNSRITLIRQEDIRIDVIGARE
jgi:hypothetical protein